MYSWEDKRCGEDEEDLFCSSWLPAAVVIVVGSEASWRAKQMEQHDGEEVQMVVEGGWEFPAAAGVVVVAAPVRLLVAI